MNVFALNPPLSSASATPAGLESAAGNADKPNSSLLSKAAEPLIPPLPPLGDRTDRYELLISGLARSMPFDYGTALQDETGAERCAVERFRFRETVVAGIYAVFDLTPEQAEDFREKLRSRSLEHFAGWTGVLEMTTHADQWNPNAPEEKRGMFERTTRLARPHDEA